MMKNLLTTLCFVMCISTAAFADSFNVGGKKVEVPSPAGFVRVTPEMDAVYRLTEQLLDPANDQLAYYISESEVPFAKQGELPLLERNFILKVNKKIKSVVLGSNDFVKLKNATKNQNQKIIDTVKAKSPELFDKINQGISKEFDMNFAMQVSQVVPLAPHFEDPNAMSFSMFVTYDLNAGGSDQEEVVCCTTTFLNTAGKVLFLYCYGSPKDLEWTRNASRAWMEKVMASNAAPPEKTAGKGRVGQYDWMAKWMIAGVLLAVLAIAKKICRKIDSKTTKKTA